MIPVTRPYLPNSVKFKKLVDGIFERNWLTNDGPLVKELTERLEEYLGVENLLLVSNGTIALQIAYRSLGLADTDNTEAVTTPFSFVATTSSLKWEGIQPVFTDIAPDTLCLNPETIEASICEKTRSIVPVHVFGNCCDVEEIEKIAVKWKLKIIYDGAHAFGVRFKDKSVLSCGDATTLSFHATKLFHTCEGGAVIFRNKDDLELAKSIINFGIEDVEHIGPLGINGKMSELHAAMGLCVLDDIDNILGSRKEVCDFYEKILGDYFQMPKWNPEATRNFSYFPILFKNEEELLRGKTELVKLGIATRRYFYPSLDTLTYLGPQTEQPISRKIAKTVLCLPLFAGAGKNNQLNSVQILAKE